MIQTEDLNQALHAPRNAIAYRISQLVAARFPGLAVLHVWGERDVDFDDFARSGRCELEPAEGVAAQYGAWLDEDNAVKQNLEYGAYRISWGGESLVLVAAPIALDDTTSTHSWIVARSLEVAKAFYAAVRKWDSDANAEILVHESGGFRRSAPLARQIGHARFEDLILAGDLSRELRDDVSRWRGARELYAKHRLPWKRGLLLIGPPGNGKTHAIRALINELGLRCIYVRTFRARCEEPDGIRRVFERARQIAPCVLVMEDLDALVSEANRSALLNELDGFASNEGILTLASTNHPERLDRSILDRPSRFDRKFHFALPALTERRAYLQRWAASLTEEMRPSAGALEAAADKSNGFTFAYLKELGLGAMMRWISEPTLGMDALLQSVLTTLRQEMGSAAVVLGPLPRERKIGLVIDEA